MNLSSFYVQKKLYITGSAQTMNLIPRLQAVFLLVTALPMVISDFEQFIGINFKQLLFNQVCLSDSIINKLQETLLFILSHFEEKICL